MQGRYRYGSTDERRVTVLPDVLHEEQWNKEELEALNGIVYGPALIHRERVVLPERFDRMLSALKLIEGVNKWDKKILSKQ